MIQRICRRCENSWRLWPPAPGLTACCPAMVEFETLGCEGTLVGCKEYQYGNWTSACDCSVCELADRCEYRDQYQRMPRDGHGAKGLCPKLRKE